MKSRHENDFEPNQQDDELWTLSIPGDSERFGPLLRRAQSAGGVAARTGASGYPGDENSLGKEGPRRSEPLDTAAKRSVGGEINARVAHHRVAGGNRIWFFFDVGFRAGLGGVQSARRPAHPIIHETSILTLLCKSFAFNTFLAIR
jgi:hypothetical protein